MKRALQIVAILASLSLAAFANRTVRDEFGRDVTVPDHPHRLVCLAPSLTDMVYALGRGDDIVGITDYTKYPAEALQKPSVGEVISPSLEKLVSLHPDLVLATDLNSADLVRSIEGLGLPVYMVHPRGLHDIYRSLENLGSILDAEPRQRRWLPNSRRAKLRCANASRENPSLPSSFFCGLTRS